ncbi:MAG: hypothetical protein AB1791_12490 [Chloroflexota bacterium]
MPTAPVLQAEMPNSLSELPDHSTARPLRQAAVLQMQQRRGNGYVQRVLQRRAEQLHSVRPTGTPLVAQPAVPPERIQRAGGETMRLSVDTTPRTREETVSTSWGSAPSLTEDSEVHIRAVTTTLGYGADGRSTNSNAVRGQVYVGFRIYDFRDNVFSNDEYESDLSYWVYFRVEDGKVVLDPNTQQIAAEVEGGDLEVTTGLITQGSDLYKIVVNMKYARGEGNGSYSFSLGPVEYQPKSEKGAIARGYEATSIQIVRPAAPAANP